MGSTGPKFSECVANAARGAWTRLYEPTRNEDSEKYTKKAFGVGLSGVSV